MRRRVACYSADYPREARFHHAAVVVRVRRPRRGAVKPRRRSLAFSTACGPQAASILAAVQSAFSDAASVEVCEVTRQTTRGALPPVAPPPQRGRHRGRSALHDAYASNNLENSDVTPTAMSMSMSMVMSMSMSMSVLSENDAVDSGRRGASSALQITVVSQSFAGESLLQRTQRVWDVATAAFYPGCDDPPAVDVQPPPTFAAVHSHRKYSVRMGPPHLNHM